MLASIFTLYVNITLLHFKHPLAPYENAITPFLNASLDTYETHPLTAYKPMGQGRGTDVCTGQ